jgi:hypothetical protein
VFTVVKTGSVYINEVGKHLASLSLERPEGNRKMTLRIIVVSWILRKEGR